MPDFNPARDRSLALTLRGEQLLWRRYERSFSHELTLTGGNYWQQDHGSGGIGSLRYQQTWRDDPLSSLNRRSPWKASSTMARPSAACSCSSTSTIGSDDAPHLAGLGSRGADVVRQSDRCACDRTRQAIVSVAFHDVVDDPAGLDGDAVTTARLVAFFDYLRGAGWTAITLDDVDAARRGERALPDKAILLTFDDGFASLYTRAYRCCWPIGCRSSPRWRSPGWRRHRAARRRMATAACRARRS